MFVSFLFYQMCIEASLLSPLSPPESMLMRLCFGICEINSAKSSISSQSSATPMGSIPGRKYRETDFEEPCI